LKKKENQNKESSHILNKKKTSHLIHSFLDEQEN
jgi:hypothetical protein